MKTLFISFDIAYPLSTTGNFVVVKYDLLNDLFYEIGAELSFLSKVDSISDKAKIISDFGTDRPDEYRDMVNSIKNSLVSVMLNDPDQDSVIYHFPETYIDWLTYHSIPEYSIIGKRLKELEGKISINAADIYSDYVKAFIEGDVKTTVNSDYDIKKFTFAEISGPNGKSVSVIKSFRDDLTYETYEGSWVQCELGYAYHEGVGVAKEPSISFRHYYNSALQNNAVAANMVGFKYQNGSGVEKDEKEAVKWYKKGCELNNLCAFANLGYCYHLGIGVEVNYQKAVENYIKGAEGGWQFAQNNLGNIYYEGLLGEPDYKQAFKWYSTSAKADGWTHAQSRAGIMMIEGKGTDKDVQGGLALLKKSALTGDVDKMINYAHNLCEYGTDEQKQEAFDYLLNESKKVNIKPEGQYEIARMAYSYPDVISYKKGEVESILNSSVYYKYAPAIQLKKRIENDKAEKERKEEEAFNKKAEQWMTTSFLSPTLTESWEKQFIEQFMDKDIYLNDDGEYNVDSDGYLCKPDFEYLFERWEEKFIEKDKFGIKYNRKYRRLISAKDCTMNFDYRYQCAFQELENTNQESDLMQRSISQMKNFEIARSMANPDNFKKMKYVIEEGTKIICDNAFTKCDLLKSIQIPDSIEIIGTGAFTNCQNLELINIPKSVKAIGGQAFGFNENLKTVIFNTSDFEVFGCDDPKEVDFMFNYSESLKEIIIPDGSRDFFANLFPSVANLLIEKGDLEKNTASGNDTHTNDALVEDAVVNSAEEPKSSNATEFNDRSETMELLDDLDSESISIDDEPEEDNNTRSIFRKVLKIFKK